jgi:hypothetical protein
MRDRLMILHSLCFFLICIVLTPRLPEDMQATDLRLSFMQFIGTLYYLYDTYLLYLQTGTLMDSMAYHHIMAAVFSSLFLVYQQGHYHYQFYGWNEVAPIFHKLSRFSDSFFSNYRFIFRILHNVDGSLIPLHGSASIRSRTC